MDDSSGRQPVGSSYSSPSMQYPAYNANGQHAAPEAYRASPQQQQSSMSQGPLLPPIQHFKAETMQSQPHYAAVPMNGAQMQQPPPPHPYNPNQFHYQNGGMQPAPMPSNVSANGQTAMMRFPLPPQAGLPQDMSGGRSSKKEIKRRTKTGCLTCRKRRIKVSEYSFGERLRLLKVQRKARRLNRDGRTATSERPRRQARLCS